MLLRIRFLLSLTLILGFGMPLSAQPVQEPNKVQWAASFKAALEQAKAKNRPVFVDVYADWCGWCKRLDLEVFARDPVAQVLNNKFVPVKVDGDQEPEFLQHYAIEGLPSMLVLEADGSEVGRIAGYKTAEALQKELTEILRTRVILHDLKANLAKKTDDLEPSTNLAPSAGIFSASRTPSNTGPGGRSGPGGTVVNREQALLPLAKSFGLTEARSRHRVYRAIHEGVSRIAPDRGSPVHPGGDADGTGKDRGSQTGGSGAAQRTGRRASTDDSRWSGTTAPRVRDTGNRARIRF